jgi:hypothetical protein
MRLPWRYPALDRATAEALLSRRLPERASDDARCEAEVRVVAALVEAASWRGPAELAGEQAALAAFRAAGLRTAAPTGAPSRIRATARRLTIVQLVAAIGLAGGGVAFAAAAGLTPSPLRWPAASDPAAAPAPPRAGVPVSSPVLVAPPTYPPYVRPILPPVVTQHPPAGVPIADQSQAVAPVDEAGHEPRADPPAKPTPANPTPAKPPTHGPFRPPTHGPSRPPTLSPATPPTPVPATQPTPGPPRPAAAPSMPAPHQPHGNPGRPG